MNAKNKLNKKFVKIIVTMMLVIIFQIGELCSPFAALANAAGNGNSTQDVKIEVVDYETKEPIEGVNIIFDKNNNTFTPVVATGNEPTYYSYLNEYYNYIAYNVNNGRNRTIDVDKSGYSVYNMYKISKNKTTCFVYQGTTNPPYVINPNTLLIKIELKKNDSTNISTLPEVKIDVTDTSGILDEYYVRSDNPLQRVDKDVKDNNYVLKGDAYANFTLNSQNANAFEYSIIENNAMPADMPTNGWTVMNPQAETGNQDVDIYKQGYLTQKAYDVNHMLTLTDNENWNDPTQVFKYPYPEIGNKSADTSTTKEAYGTIENVVPYTINDANGNQITVNKRFSNNTVFMSGIDMLEEYKEASKFWGYLSVPEDGDYILGATSDDGCRGWITVNGETNKFVDMFYPQGSTFGAENITLNLKAGKYYPLYLEYFNLGSSATFQLNYAKNQSNITDSNKTAIPKEWFYPSKSTSPGEYAQSLFTRSNGVKLPKSPGQYYIAYRTGTKNSDGSIDFSKNCREGIYGPFIVKPSTILEHGLYNRNGTVITNDKNVTATVPVTLAMKVDAGSSNPVINWTADKTKIEEENIVFKKYVIDNNTITGIPETVTFTNSGNVDLTGLTMEEGKQYIIIYTITPTESGQVTVKGTAEGTDSKSVTLNIGEKPDLF